MTKESIQRVDAASLVAVRFFQLDTPPDLEKLDARAPAEARRPQFPGGADARISFAVPPLELVLGEMEIELEDSRVYADVTARIFDFGVVALGMRVLVGGLDWERFEDRIDQVESAVRTTESAREQERLLRQGLRPLLGEAGDRMTPANGVHLFIIVRRLAEPLGADDAMSELGVAALVAADRQPLSGVARVDVMRGGYSYHSDDLVMVGEDRVFILEPEAHKGVPDAIEAAFAQRFTHVHLRDQLNGTGRSSAATTGAALLQRAERSVVVRPGGLLPGVYGTARDRLRVAEAELAAERRLAASRVKGSGLIVGLSAAMVALAVVMLVVVLTLVG